MKKIFILLISLFCKTAFSQTAEDYFHTSAQLYIQEKKTEAKENLIKGIQKYPSEKKLQELLAKIKDEEKKDNKQNQNKNDDKNKDKKKDEKKQQQQQQKQDISKEDAQRLLEAMNNDEKKLRDKMNEKKMKAANGQIEKDW
jgi:Ca-activated chloride channel homolog